MFIEIFKKYLLLFKKHGFSLYSVGGTTRDYLLGIEPSDLDFVTDATPEDMKNFLPDSDYSFSKYGTVKVKEDNLDITTLRIEGKYDDFRHPSFIKFIKEPKEDYKRRDFTINALYLDENLNVLDYCNGLADLKNGIIRFIGDPDIRIKEDPLRILRAERFKERFNFKIEQKTLESINKNRKLLEKLNKDKVRMELKKSK